MDLKARQFDIVFTCSEKSVNNYLNNGTKEAYFLPPPVVIKHQNNQFDRDISIIIGDLFWNQTIYNDQKYNRKNLIDRITKMDYKIEIFGPELIKEIYPNHYQKYLNYNEMQQIYNTSKLNLSTHVSKSTGYISERDMLILANGGLLFTDNVHPLMIDNYDCIKIDIVNLESQIEMIIKEDKEMIRKRGKEFIEKHNDKNWGRFIHFYISKILFDSCSYKLNYKLPLTWNSINTWDHFIMYGLDQCHFPIKIEPGIDKSLMLYKHNYNLYGYNNVYIQWHKSKYKFEQPKEIKEKKNDTMNIGNIINRMALFDIYVNLNEIDRELKTNKIIEFIDSL